MAQDYAMTVKFDAASGSDWGKAAATAIMGGLKRVDTAIGGGGGKPGAGGSAAESLVRMIPGGSFFTNIGKAFGQGGLMVGMATGIVSVVALGKSLLAGSKVFQTMTSTFQKTIGAMIDMMLAPLIPLFMKFLGWWIKEGFKYAQMAGQYLAEKLPILVEKIGKIIEFFGGMDNIFKWMKKFFYVWFGLWVMRKAVGAVRGIAKGVGLAGRGIGAVGRKLGAGKLLGKLGLGRSKTFVGKGGKLFFGKPGASKGFAPEKLRKVGYDKAGKLRFLKGSGKTGYVPKKLAQEMGKSTVKKGLFKRLGLGGLRKGIGRLGAGLATKTGAKVALRLGTGIITKRGGAMLSGALMGGAIGGVAGAGVGAIPGALIGAIAGLVIGQAAGVAIDAATGAEITLATALLPGAAEFRDVKAIYAASGDKDLAEQAARIKAEAESLDQMVGRELDESYAKIIGRPDSAVPATMGTVMGIYSSLNDRAEEANDKLGSEDNDDPGFWSGWGSKISGLFKGAWGIVTGWWNGIFGSSAGAGTSDGGQPSKDPPDEEGGGIVAFFGEWAGKIGGFFKSAWSTVGGWWNKITGGAKDNEPKDPHEDDDSGTFFPQFLTDIGALFKTGWGFVKGWWSGLKDKVTGNQPKEESDPSESSLGSTLMGIITNPVGSIVAGFKKGADFVTGWWDKLRGKQDGMEPGEESDPAEATLGETLMGILTNPVGSIIAGFKKGANFVTGWWDKLRGKQDGMEPGEESDPSESSLGSTLMGILTNPVGSIISGFKAGAGFVTGWWDKLRGKQDENEPGEESDPSEASLGSTLMGILTNPIGSIISGFKAGANFVTGWWDKLRGKQDENEPGEESDPSETSLGATLMGFITNPIGSIVAGFKKGANFVTGWWDKLRGKQDENEPVAASDPSESIIGSTLKGIIGGVGNLVGTVFGGFKKGWTAVSGWWSGLKRSQDSNDPNAIPDPSETVMSSALGLIVGVAGIVGDTIRGGFKKGWGTVSGWWTKLKDKVKEGQPGDNDQSSILGGVVTFFGGVATILSDALGSLATWVGEQVLKVIEAIPIVGKPIVAGMKATGGLLQKGWGLVTRPFNQVGGTVEITGSGGKAFQTGGVIPGPQGALGLAVVHSGELILPTHSGPGWMDSTKGGTDFKRAMTGTARGWGTQSGMGGSGGGGMGTSNSYMTMNRPTIINISTTENVKEVLEGIAKLEMLEDAAFFSSLA